MKLHSTLASAHVLLPCFYVRRCWLFLAATYVAVGSVAQQSTVGMCCRALHPFRKMGGFIGCGQIQIIWAALPVLWNVQATSADLSADSSADIGKYINGKLIEHGFQLCFLHSCLLYVDAEIVLESGFWPMFRAICHMYFSALLETLAAAVYCCCSGMTGPSVV
jgi:hypothetical protein